MQQTAPEKMVRTGTQEMNLMTSSSVMKPVVFGPVVFFSFRYFCPPRDDSMKTTAPYHACNLLHMASEISVMDSLLHVSSLCMLWLTPHALFGSEFVFRVMCAARDS
jgi:hypothetical protein